MELLKILWSWIHGTASAIVELFFSFPQEVQNSVILIGLATIVVITIRGLVKKG